MLTMKKLTLMGSVVALSAFLLSPRTQAATYSDASSAVLVFPRIVVSGSRDTVVQIANESLSRVVGAHCFYVNANSFCSNNHQVCTPETAAVDCFDATSGFTGACTPGWIETDFDVVMTPGQPLAWSAARGLVNARPNDLADGHVPCPGGLLNRGSCIGSNAGTRVPPVGNSSFTGELKCIESDPVTGLPPACSGLDCAADPGGCCHDDLIGSATIEDLTSTGDIDVARYNAVGLRSTGTNDGDNSLQIGGESGAEYQPCADVLIFNHLFDGATDPITTNDPATPVLIANTDLTLVPCTENFANQIVPQVSAQFLVYNEFEQRFSTSKTVNCLLDSPISEIDTSQPTRSIFSAGVAGTVGGQTRIHGVNGGLLGSATLALCDPAGCDTRSVSAGYNLNQSVDRSDPDFITEP